MREAIIELKNKREKGQHAGLLLQRYLCENATGKNGNHVEKREILQAAINAAKDGDVQELYTKAFNRWKCSLLINPKPKSPESSADNPCQHEPHSPSYKTEITELETSGRLIVGLGSENVLETGVRLHHTYGMPIIPGSALKGLAAHYCDQIWGERDKNNPSEEARKFRSSRKEDRKTNRAAEPQGSYHGLLFGATDDGGCIVFHDAWLVPSSCNQPLVLDVMTPHHTGWNNTENPVPPTDFDSPTPVPFLSVTGKFLIAVSWHGPTSDKAEDWIKLASSLLQEALREWGIGGKTTSGYGRLDTPQLLRPPVYKGKAGDIVEAVLLEEKTKKGGWRARINCHIQQGPIQNSQEVPSEYKPGDVVKLNLASIKDSEVAFRWREEDQKPRNNL